MPASSAGASSSITRRSSTRTTASMKSPLDAGAGSTCPGVDRAHLVHVVDDDAGQPVLALQDEDLRALVLVGLDPGGQAHGQVADHDDLFHVRGNHGGGSCWGMLAISRPYARP